MKTPEEPDEDREHDAYRSGDFDGRLVGCLVYRGGNEDETDVQPDGRKLEQERRTIWAQMGDRE